MAISNAYLQKLYNDALERTPNQPEFFQAVQEVFSSLSCAVDQDPSLTKAGIFERLIEPDRIITFRVNWTDDAGNVQVNRGYRVQYNNAIGPYKGGIRFNPTVNLSIMKFLAFEQVFKNSLTGLPMGGGKGGSDFDPRGKSDKEIMRFCQSFMFELAKYIGADTDVPAGDMGVGSREIGYMYGQYKRLTNVHTGVLTGKALHSGGSLARPEATGYGLCYYTEKMLNDKGESFNGKKVLVSGAGNVATYANQKATQLGATVIGMSDITGTIYDENGIDYKIIKKLAEEERATVAKYCEYVPTATFTPDPKNLWKIKADIALPCATQNEIDVNDAAKLIENGVFAVAEGANMPSTLDAIHLFQEKGILFGPAKAANAGGVATSGLEMSQNSQRLSWTFEEVDAKLKQIMENIYFTTAKTAKDFDQEGNLVLGANIAGFKKVADAMKWQGINY